MARRIHVPTLSIGRSRLPAAQSHHLRQVLRMSDGAEVEAFDDAGATARATLRFEGTADTSIEITSITPTQSTRLQWTVLSAIPKGQRADWMIEKLSELGTAAFVPLVTERAVVVPDGVSKIQRWARIAIESAQQSRRAGVMRIEPLMNLSDAIDHFAGSESSSATAWALATEIPAVSALEAMQRLAGHGSLAIFVGPEGGWTDPELRQIAARSIPAVRLGPTILRIETAAVAIAALLSAAQGGA